MSEPRRELNDHAGYDRKIDGEDWIVWSKTEPHKRIQLRAHSWAAARDEGIRLLGGDFSTVDARLA